MHAPTLAVRCAALALLAGLAAGCSRHAARGQILVADALDQLALGDSVQAQALLERAHFELPRDPRVLFHLGRLQARAGTIEGRALGEKSLRAAVDLRPRNGSYREALGRVLHEQGFHHESITQLQTAVAHDPSLGEAWHLLGLELLKDWREEPTDTALRDSTQRCFDNALVAQPGNGDARWYAIALRMHAGALAGAQALCTVATGRDGCASRFFFLQAAIEFRMRRFDGAEHLLSRGLAQLSPAGRESWTGIRKLIPPDSIPSYDLHTPAARDSLSMAWWWERDPTPTTLSNERRLEHVMRLQEADLLFEPVYRRRDGRDTDRGEVWLRWGEPRSMTRDVTAGPRAWYWDYADRDGDSMTFVFLDEFLNGDYRLRRPRAGEDYSRRQAFDRVPEVSRMDWGEPPPPWQFAMARFRGPRGRTTVEFWYEVLDSSVTRLTADATAWRGMRDPAASHLEPAAPGGLSRWQNRAVGRLRLDVPPPAREVALQLQTAATRAHGAWRAAARRPLEVEGPVPDMLELSDLMPAYAVRPGGAEPTGRDAVVVPRVDSLVTGGELHVYFEVYPSRRAVRAERALKLTYRVRMLPKPWHFRDQFRTRFADDAPVAVEAAFEVRSRLAVVPQVLSLNLQALEPGPYRFELEARDPMTQVVAVRRWGFVIPEPGQTPRGR